MDQNFENFMKKHKAVNQELEKELEELMKKDNSYNKKDQVKTSNINESDINCKNNFIKIL
jgi:hypothetical protein